MGMHEYEVGLIEISLDFLQIGFEDCVMAELGNQRIRYLENYWDRVSWPGANSKDGKIIEEGFAVFKTNL